MRYANGVGSGTFFIVKIQEVVGIEKVVWIPDGLDATVGLSPPSK